MANKTNSLDSFTCALITGGGGGIGRAMAEYFISKGKKVLIAGRTESNLAQTHKEIGTAGYYVLDTGDTASIPAFIARITREHPDLDCLVNNAGVQRPLRVLDDDAAELLAKADAELDINVRGPLHLAVGLLAHLRTRPAALIVNVSSTLAFVPMVILVPNYNATKAWLHAWSMGLRAQLRDATAIKVVEIAPPLVGTDLHRDQADPDNNKKWKTPYSLDLDEFMAEVAERFERGDETFAAGMGQPVVEQWFGMYGERFEQAAKNWK